MGFIVRSFAVFASIVLVLASAKDEEKEKEVGTVIGIDLGTTYSW